MYKNVTLTDNISTFKVDIFKTFKEYPLKYWKYSNVHKHLYYFRNKKYVNYVELIKGPLPKFHEYRLKNNNPFDLRKKNIQYHDISPDNGDKIIKGRKGHKVGHRIINPYWKMQDLNSEEKYYMMYVKPNKYFKFSPESLDIVKGKSWFITPQGYAAAMIKAKMFGLHQLITNHHGHGKGNNSVDHINMDKLDNRQDNLRVANQQTQNLNRPKQKRKINLNKCIIEPNDVPTWISHVNSYGHHGEYFDIQVWGNLGKDNVWRRKTTKSKKISLEAKFIEALKLRANKVHECPQLLEGNIDGKQFSSFNTFWEHNKKLIDKYAKRGNIEITPELLKFDNVVMEITGKQREQKSFPEESKHTPNDLPKYVTYLKAKNNRGSFLEYKKKTDNKMVRFSTCSKKKMPLDDKIKDIIEKVNNLIKADEKMNKINDIQIN
jgi:hypothetical protein